MDLINSKILLTGATGIIGGEIYSQLPNKNNVYVLSRTNKNAQEKLEWRQNTIIGNKNDNKFNIVYGDISKKNWGLDSFDYDIVIHSAADTSFIHKKKCHDTNVKGIESLIRLIKNSRNEVKLVYIGSASSHGAVKDKSIDETFKGIKEHHNYYTRTKLEGEELIKRKLKNYLILKPTIVLADNVNDNKLINSISWVFYATKYFNKLPFNNDSLIDFIPLSYLGNVIIKLLEKNELKYDEYLISAGKSNCISVKKIVDFLNIYFNRIPLLIDPDITIDYQGMKRRIYKGIKYYLPFINMNVIYSNNRIKKELLEFNECPVVTMYLGCILNKIDEKSIITEVKNP